MSVFMARKRCCSHCPAAVESAWVNDGRLVIVVFTFFILTVVVVFVIAAGIGAVYVWANFRAQSNTARGPQ